MSLKTEGPEFYCPIKKCNLDITKSKMTEQKDKVIRKAKPVAGK